MLQSLPPPDPPASVITVTGQALPDARADSGYAVSEIDREELEAAPTEKLDQILKQVPGLQLFRRSDSTSGHPTSQGVTLRALGGNAASRALLVLDGVPQADPFGGWVNWPAYDPAGLEQVRITRGGGSVAHGPGALAGVIDMTSRSAEEADAFAEAGSRGSLLGRGYAGVDTGPGLLALNARGSRSRGFVPLTKDTRGPIDRRSPYEEASLRARWNVLVSPDIELQAGGFGFVDVRERGLPFTTNRTDGLDGSLRLVGSGRWQWSATAYAQWRNFRSSFAAVDDERTQASRVSLQDSVPSEGIGGRLEARPPVGGGVELSIGADARWTDGESKELYAYADGSPTRRRVAGGESRTAGLFAEGSWVAGPVTLSAGARVDHWAISRGRLVERLLSTGEATRDEHYPERTGWRATARGAALASIGGGFEFRSAAYLGWRLPTLNELFRPFRVGPDATAANPLLDPEGLSGAEVELRHVTPSVELSLTAFANRLSDAIANVTLGHGPGQFPGVGFVAGAYRQRQNVGAISVRGVEASGELQRGAWSFRLGASYSDAKVVASGAASALNGLRPAQTPDLTLSAGVTWEDRGRIASLLVHHSGPQFEDDLNSRRLPAATTVDALVGWPLSKGLQLVMRGENLLDEEVVAGIAGDGAVERATPLTLWIGLRLRAR